MLFYLLAFHRRRPAGIALFDICLKRGNLLVYVSNILLYDIRQFLLNRDGYQTVSLHENWADARLFLQAGRRTGFSALRLRVRWI